MIALLLASAGSVNIERGVVTANMYAVEEKSLVARVF